MPRIAPLRHRSRWRFVGGGALSVAAAIVLHVAVLTLKAADLLGPEFQAAGQTELHNHPGRPAHVYQGDCDRLGEVKYSLNPVGAGAMADPAMAGEPVMAAGDPVGSAVATAIEVGAITLAIPLDEIVVDELAVAIHRSESEYGVWVVCGEVGGAITADGLAFNLCQQNESGLSGVAVLTPTGSDTSVTIYLGSGLNGMVSASAVASREQEAKRFHRPV